MADRRRVRLVIPSCWSCCSNRVEVVGRRTYTVEVRCARCREQWSIAKPGRTLQW
jgi:hypothetical protein